MAEWTTDRIEAADGTAIALHTRADQARRTDRPVLMIHGFLADAVINWITPGIADQLADAGHRVIALDLRGHGQSGAPAGAAFWPVDILADDALTVVQQLGLTDYDLVGYSLGGRTSARMMVRGARPRRAVLGGMGAAGIMAAGVRAEMFRDSILNGEAAKDPRAGRYIQALIRQRGLSVDAMLGVLDSFAPTTEADLRAIPVPTLVVSGDKDEDNGSPEELAALLPHGRALRIEGDHLTAVSRPLGQAIVDFLSAPTAA